MFGRTWESGEATILASHVTKTTGDGMVSIREFAAEVRTAGGEPFRTVIHEPRIATNFWAPEVGACVRVKVDVRRQKAKFDTSDPTISAKRRQEAGDAAFRAVLEDRP